uniref:Uncharacterized protein n=1 Tax=Plectus sambesii TaxID=2011161 RepID=A0A914V3E8_9BILA
MSTLKSYQLLIFLFVYGRAQNSDKGSCYTGKVKLYQLPPVLSDADKNKPENICAWKDSVCVAFRSDTLPPDSATYGCFPTSKVSSFCGSLASRTNRTACQKGELNGEKGEICCCLGDNCNGQSAKDYINTVQCKVGSKIQSGVVPSQETFCTILSVENNVEKVFMCYSFQAKDDTTRTNYGCSPVIHLPSGCTTTLVGMSCQPGYNYDELGSVCCCHGNNCNVPGASPIVKSDGATSSTGTGATRNGNSASSNTLAEGDSEEHFEDVVLSVSSTVKSSCIFVWLALALFCWLGDG